MEPSRNLLLVGNILNNGYLHAKFLRLHAGIHADSLNVDYSHCQGQPEWAEVEITEYVDQWQPDWGKIDLKGFKRPEWFFDVGFKDVENMNGVFEEFIQGENKKNKLNSFIHGLLKGVKSTSLFIKSGCKTSDANNLIKGINQADKLIDEFNRYYPGFPTKLRESDILEWLPRAQGFSRLFSCYKLIHCFSLDAIYPLLAMPTRPFVAYEHGTMREFPFENSSRGRLYALSLKKAEKVLISNADCNLSAERLGLDNYAYIPHIIDDELFKPEESVLREKLKQETGCDFILVAPARHHWKYFPDGLEHSWSKRNDIMIRGLGRVFRNYPDLKVLVIFFEWGKEVELSKQLIRECGFQNRVKWVPLCSKPVLKKYYNAADIILDQFNNGIGTFGAVVPEAFACGKPVILNYKESLHHWCFPKLPPVINAENDEEIEKIICRLLKNQQEIYNIGMIAREWFLNYHSTKIVISKLINIYKEIYFKYGWQLNMEKNLDLFN